MLTNELPLRSVSQDPDAPLLPQDTRPATLAPVAQLLDHGLELGPVTVFISENGAGKSTLVEAIAGAHGMDPEGGSTGSRHTTRKSESTLSDHLRLNRGLGANRGGFFLRAETMHGFFTYLEHNPGGKDPIFHDRSHGESFLDLVGARSRYPGLWIMDEPESALSFAGSLALLSYLRDIVEAGGSQVILSTHSPILASIPGAAIFEVGPWGYRSCAWEDLDLVRNWRSFLDDPERYHRLLS